MLLILPFRPQGCRFVGVCFLKLRARFFSCGLLMIYIAVGFLITGYIFCYADEEAKIILDKQEVVVNDAVKDDTVVLEENGEEEEGMFVFRDPFLSGLPKKVETKVVSIPSLSSQTDSVYESADESGPDEFDYSSLAVSGLFWGGDKPKAIINNDILGIGSVINGATIIQIDAKGILFEYNDKQFLLQRSDK